MDSQSHGLNLFNPKKATHTAAACCLAAENMPLNNITTLLLPAPLHNSTN
jgi:hypothetical protein